MSSSSISSVSVPTNLYFQERIDYIEGEIQEITRNARNLKSDYLSLIELKLLIEKMQTFFQDHSAARKISASVQIYNNEAGRYTKYQFL